MKVTIRIVLLVLGFSTLAQDLQLIVPLGHSRRVSDMDVSSDGQWLATVDGSDHVKIWNYQSGEEMYQLQGHKGQVTRVDFHPKGSKLVSAGSEGSIIIWTPAGKILQTLEIGSPVLEVQFVNDIDVVVLTGSVLEVWSVADGKQLSSTSLKRSATSLAIFGLTAFVGCKNGEVLQVDLAEGRVVDTYMTGESEISTLTTSADGELLYVGNNAGNLLRIHLESREIGVKKTFEIRNYKVLADKDLIYTAGRDTEKNFKVFSKELNPQPEPFALEGDPGSEAFSFGLSAMSLTDSTLLIADYNQVIREWNIEKGHWAHRAFKGLAAPVYDLSVNFSEKQLAIASGHEFVKVIDLTATHGDLLLEGYPKGTRSLDFHPVNPMIATYGLDETILVKDIISRQDVFTLKAKGDYSTTPVAFDPTGRYILRKSSDEAFDFYDFKRKSPRTIKVKNGTDFHFPPDGRRLFFLLRDGIQIYDPVTVKELGELKVPDIQDFAFHKDGSFTVLLKDDLTLYKYSKDQKKISEVVMPPTAASDRIFSVGEYLIGYKNSVSRGAQPDFTLKVINQKGELARQLPGHSGFVTSLESVKDRFLFTASADGQIKVWDVNHKEPYKASLIPMDGHQYVVTTAMGLFDATPEAMKKLHYVKDGNIIALEQLKTEYYEPNLLSKILGYNEEPLKTVAAISSLNLYPELNIDHPLKNDGKLGINLSDNGGGIGRIVILINGKEVSSDVRAANTLEDQNNMDIDYAIEGHPFLYNDRVNKVTIKAFNKDGTLSSEAKSIYLFGEEKVVEQPRLFALFAGTSDYEGDALDLKYAAKDASDFAKAVKLSATKYLGEDNVTTRLLTTDLDQSSWPTKENITSVFQEFSKQATAKDILMVYLSGHGVNHSGKQSDFYYLTSTASSGDLNNPMVRESVAISSAEFTEYIKTVPALKQILVIDACHSGRMASSLASSRSAMSSTQIRALERMKDRTGMFVLAGSAADAVSYETTLFGQGLLTYSLLFGMKGAALRDNEFIDVLELFQFAANKVPELAEEIGGVQKPEIRLPEDGKSFDIGRLENEDRDKITLKAPKPVFVHSRFQDESAIYDHLNISDLLDQKLLELSKENDPKWVFVDDKSFSGAYTVHGRYKEEEGLIKGTVSIEKDQKEIKTFKIESVNIDVFTSQLIDEVINLITDK